MAFTIFRMRRLFRTCSSGAHRKTRALCCSNRHKNEQSAWLAAAQMRTKAIQIMNNQWSGTMCRHMTIAINRDATFAFFSLASPGLIFRWRNTALRLSSALITPLYDGTKMAALRRAGAA